MRRARARPTPRRREPLAYVLGDWDFRRLTLKTDARALVRRPETEVVVDRCLALLEDAEAPHVLDVGTGTGAIALALKQELPDTRVTATDVSPGALELARENAVANGLNVDFVQTDLLAGVRRASSSAPGDTSVAVTRVSGSSCLSASAMAPVPVPTSSSMGSLGVPRGGRGSGRQPPRSRGAARAPGCVCLGG